MVSNNVRKWGLIITAFLVVAGTLIGYYFRVTHWINISFDLFSYSPWLPFASWIVWVGSLASLYFTKQKESIIFKFLLASWFIINIIFTYGILVTWWV